MIGGVPGSVRTDAELRRHLAERQWYHSIELRPGVVTPGWFDTRPLATALPWPDLSGKRCLDVGTFDGFWALTMEARGAAEVLAIDLLDPHQWEWPANHEEAVVEALGQRKRAGDGFALVVEELKSQVKRAELSVYDLDASQVGEFDVVYFGSLLLHLRDPVKALERVRGVLRPGGRMLLVDAIDWELSLRHPRAPVARLDGQGRPWWWRPNLAALQRMVEAAGFAILDGPHRYLMPPGAGGPVRRLRQWRAVTTARGRQQIIDARLGDPHAWILAEPHS
jgi:tRNA (mo5U34)-methyltransferase